MPITLNGAGSITGATIMATAVQFSSNVGITGAATLSGGWAFPATQVPSSDPNILDDYEEGTWTATLNMHSDYTNTSTTNTTIASTGIYVKVGQLVHISAYFDVTAYNNYVAKTITGLPFTAINSGIEQPLGIGHIRGIKFVYSSTVYDYWNASATVAPGATSIYLATSYGVTATSGWWYITNTSGQGKYINVSGTYRAAA